MRPRRGAPIPRRTNSPNATGRRRTEGAMTANIKHTRRRFLAASLATLAAAPLGLLACADLHASEAAGADPSTIKENTPMQQTAPRAISLPVEGEFPSLAGATGWLNSQPLTPDSLRGKVVLVEFWTYTCINWLRTLSHVRAWSEKYRDHGLVVIGVHTPEFLFEKD